MSRVDSERYAMMMRERERAMAAHSRNSDVEKVIGPSDEEIRSLQEKPIQSSRRTELRKRAILLGAGIMSSILGLAANQRRVEASDLNPKNRITTPGKMTSLDALPYTKEGKELIQSPDIIGMQAITPTATEIATLDAMKNTSPTKDTVPHKQYKLSLTYSPTDTVTSPFEKGSPLDKQFQELLSVITNAQVVKHTAELVITRDTGANVVSLEVHFDTPITQLFDNGPKEFTQPVSFAIDSQGNVRYIERQLRPGGTGDKDTVGLIFTIPEDKSKKPIAEQIKPYSLNGQPVTLEEGASFILGQQEPDGTLAIAVTKDNALPFVDTTGEEKTATPPPGDKADSIATEVAPKYPVYPKRADVPEVITPFDLSTIKDAKPIKEVYVPDQAGKPQKVEVTSYGQLKDGQVVALNEKGEIVAYRIPGKEHGNDWFVPVLNCETCAAPLEVDMSSGMYDTTALVKLNAYVKSIGGPSQFVDIYNKSFPSRKVLGYKFETTIKTLTDAQESAVQSGRPDGLIPSPVYGGKNPEKTEDMYDGVVLYTVGKALGRTDYDVLRGDIEMGKIEIMLPNGKKWNPKDGITVVMRRVPSDDEITQMLRHGVWARNHVLFEVDSHTGRLVINSWDTSGTEGAMGLILEVFSEVTKTYGNNPRNIATNVGGGAYFYLDDYLLDIINHPLGDHKWMWGGVTPIFMN